MTAFFPRRTRGIILAADLPTVAANCEVLDQVSDLVDAVKIGSPLVYSEGFGAIESLKARYLKPVFADLKVADVPHTNAKIIRQVAESGGDAVMVHGIVGPDGLADALDAADGRLGIIVQLELTNPGGRMFSQPIADDVASMAATFPVYGFQAPGNRPERVARIRAIVGCEPVIVCCGVGHQGGTCRAVFEAGGDFAIVGRAIYGAVNPRAALESLAAPSVNGVGDVP